MMTLPTDHRKRKWLAAAALILVAVVGCIVSHSPSRGRLVGRLSAPERADLAAKPTDSPAALAAKVFLRDYQDGGLASVKAKYGWAWTGASGDLPPTINVVRFDGARSFDGTRLEATGIATVGSGLSPCEYGNFEIMVTDKGKILSFGIYRRG